MRELFGLLEKQNRVIEDIHRYHFKEREEFCNALCGVLDQSYAGSSEEDTGVYRTQYNYDAVAVDLLQKHGYVEILDGNWPQTKYLTFKFTEKRVR